MNYENPAQHATRRQIVVFCFIGLLLLLVVCSLSCSLKIRTTQQSDAAPDPALTIKGLKQERQVFVVNFWSVTCLPCIAKMPALNKLSERLAERQITLVGMSIDDPKETFEQVKEIMQNKGVQYPIGFATPTDIAKYNVQATPTTLVFDRTGKVFTRREGGGDGFTEWIWNAALSAETRQTAVTYLGPSQHRSE